MNSNILRRPKVSRKTPPQQPIDRHAAEIGECDGSIYINAGIDSTCCRKRGRTIHSLTNGIVVASSQQTNRNDLLAELTSDNSNDETFEMIDRSNSGK